MSEYKDTSYCIEASTIIPKVKRKNRENVRVHFRKDGSHYPFGEGQVDNYKFKATLEYVEYAKQDGKMWVTWKDIETDKEYYSLIGTLHKALIGEEGKMSSTKGKLQVKAEFTFVKIESAVLLTYA